MTEVLVLYSAHPVDLLASDVLTEEHGLLFLCCPCSLEHQGVNPLWELWSQEWDVAPVLHTISQAL